MHSVYQAADTIRISTNGLLIRAYNGVENRRSVGADVNASISLASAENSARLERDRENGINVAFFPKSNQNRQFVWEVRFRRIVDARR
jgi:hypothetical protein